ncbi:MAG: hypothetical protein QOG00_2051 [Pyrinomonadaceae bacterium]|nr:hypothetical protein [Pyrinomonadaceae bacterium]
MLRETKFSIDTLGNRLFDGFTIGEEWKGWACPYFTFEQSLRVVKAFNENEWFDGGKVIAHYNAEKDMFRFFFESTGESDDFTANDIEGQKLYPIGASCWIWEEALENSVA